MKPNNEFTSSETRFFYPINHAVEYHESLDVSSLPGTESIPGHDHYVLVADAEGTVEYAAALVFERYNLPVNSMPLGVVGHAERRSTYTPFIRPDAFEAFAPECSYLPADDEAVQMIVKVDLSRFFNDIPDSRFNHKGIAVLPQGTPLPSFAAAGIDDERVKYQLLGYIDEADKLITWHGEVSETAELVDFCVANQLVQNRLEESLLLDALPLGGHLVGMLNVSPVAKAYLEYFDAKHGTAYVPEEDPRFPYAKRKFGNLTEEEYPEYRRLAELSDYYMRRSR